MPADVVRKRGKKRIWLMPQELEVWYVIPALRRELAHAMIQRGRSQKLIARILGVTEPAITQYKIERSSRSRGDQIDIPAELQPEIEKAADKILEAWDNRGDHENVYEVMTCEMNRLIRILRETGAMCIFHREHCKDVGEDCRAC